MEALKQRIGKLANEGVFGEGQLLQVVNNSEDGKGAQFASVLYFLRVDLKDESGVLKQIPVIAKVQAGAAEEEMMRTDLQFLNEVIAYTQMLPSLGACELGICPKMYYGLATKGKDSAQDLIVLEDVRPLGFKVADDILLDYDHVMLTMRKLGEFHGKSYKMKATSPNALRELGKLFAERPAMESKGMFEAFACRGLKPLMDNQIVYKAYQKYSGTPTSAFAKTIFEPEEPFAAIIHGDFNRNNLVYAYDEKNQVKSVIFLDWATPRYSNPAIDMSFFLYMNTSEDLRTAHWDAFLEAYWDGVTSVAADPGFTYGELLKHFSKRAFWGYYVSAFFLPMLLYEETLTSPSIIQGLTPEECVEWGAARGGDKVTALISGIARHLLEKGYLEDYVTYL